MHNLTFYSKKVDELYFRKKRYFLWIKQVYLRRVLFLFMLKRSCNLEVQSTHVKEYLSSFLDIKKKSIYTKSDIDILPYTINSPKYYNFSKKIRFIYIVGNHFNITNKNIDDFIKFMIFLNKKKYNFDINITITKKQAHSIKSWDNSLDDITNFLGYISNEELLNIFDNNFILISTSIVETLGLHVIDAIKKGSLCIVPNEDYSKIVYGKDIFTYDLFDIDSLYKTFLKIYSSKNEDIQNRIILIQKYVVNSEDIKYKSSLDIISSIL